MSPRITLNSKKFHFLRLLYLLTTFTLFNLSLSQEVPDINDLELIFVYEHTRHGARGPSTSYNSLFINGVDEFKVSWEGEGDGELTLLGRREHYDIGVRNRLKYGKTEGGLGLIDFNEYDPSEVLFHVTDYNRTHMSLNSQLIGMYQPGILKTLPTNLINESYPPNQKVWKVKSESDNVYKKILKEIDDLGDKTVIDSIPIFNAHPFPANRIFNLESSCKNSIEKIRMDNIKDKKELLYGYFLNHSETLRNFFGFQNDSYFTNIRMMNSIADHYISDYKNFKNLTEFHDKTGIDLEEFYNMSTKFYVDWVYNYFCTNDTCSMEASRLMEDLLGYMKRRIDLGHNGKSYKAPKMVIDCGHDTTVAPMQMFMYEAWEDKPEYGINTQYCGFSCNLYFELYKKKEEKKYYVFYYMDDELKHVFDYDEFEKTIREHIYSQAQIEQYCLSKSGESNKEEEGETFSESFKNHTALWMGFFTTCFTTLLGIIGIVILIMKLRKNNNDIGERPAPKMQELTSNFITNSDAKE